MPQQLSTLARQWARSRVQVYAAALGFAQQQERKAAQAQERERRFLRPLSLLP
jgi:hypothetical protein